MKYLVIAFLCLWIYRLVKNISSLIRINHYYDKYTLYLSKQDSLFSENTHAVVQLLKAAGIVDRLIPFTQPSGYGFVAQGNASLFQNIGNLREDVVVATAQCFKQATGTFKHRILENFSPIFWVDCVIYLPRKIIEYLGLKGDTVPVKVLQLLYWLATPLLLIFRENIYQCVISLVG